MAEHCTNMKFFRFSNTRGNVVIFLNRVLCTCYHIYVTVALKQFNYLVIPEISMHSNIKKTHRCGMSLPQNQTALTLEPKCSNSHFLVFSRFIHCCVLYLQGIMAKNFVPKSLKIISLQFKFHQDLNIEMLRKTNLKSLVNIFSKWRQSGSRVVM